VGCDHCCRYVSLEIDKPRTKRDFDNIRWYLLHKNISVMVDWEGSWLIQFDTPCEWLVDGQCTHYSLRPEICREYDPAECERYNPIPAEKILLRNEKDLELFLAEREKRSAARRKSKRKALAG
jgi:Fe-S-cluster containining protein